MHSLPCDCRTFASGALRRAHRRQKPLPTTPSCLHRRQPRHDKYICWSVSTGSFAGTTVNAVNTVVQWLGQDRRLDVSSLEPKRFIADAGSRVGLVASRDTQEDKESTLSPILWDDAERQALLAGSPVLAEARAREALLRQQWQQLNSTHFSKDTGRFPPAVFNEAAFLSAFCVVLAHACYLPTAECFALLPLASLMARTGNDNGCNMDYDVERQAVVVRPTRPYREGQEVMLNDPRPSGELLLATGDLQDNNASDHLFFTTSLVPADRYYTMKKQILEEIGLAAVQQFPVYRDRMPNQLLAYVRLSRIADPALFAKVSFERDVMLSELNEYEILQLLMGDCRERLQAYKVDWEDDIKLLQQQDLSPKQRLAARLRVAEKTILRDTMDAVRTRLAPIRGIPTKSGAMQDPNADFREMFDTFESIPKLPVTLVSNLMAWARGDFDPEWNKAKKKPMPPPKDLR